VGLVSLLRRRFRRLLTSLVETLQSSSSLTTLLSFTRTLNTHSFSHGPDLELTTRLSTHSVCNELWVCADRKVEKFYGDGQYRAPLFFLVACTDPASPSQSRSTRTSSSVARSALFPLTSLTSLALALQVNNAKNKPT
jgi:hypothetical protein